MKEQTTMLRVGDRILLLALSEKPHQRPPGYLASRDLVEGALSRVVILYFNCVMQI